MAWKVADEINHISLPEASAKEQDPFRSAKQEYEQEKTERIEKEYAWKLCLLRLLAKNFGVIFC
jgi:hypothetical protein